MHMLLDGCAYAAVPLRSGQPQDLLRRHSSSSGDGSAAASLSATATQARPRLRRRTSWALVGCA